MSKTPKRPRDTNQLAKFIVDVATGERPDEAPIEESKAAVFGRAGGQIGGKARSASLTSEQRSEIARTAAIKRWGKS